VAILFHSPLHLGLPNDFIKKVCQSFNTFDKFQREVFIMGLTLPPGLNLTSFYTDVLALASLFFVIGVTFGVYYMVTKIIKLAKKGSR